MDGEQSHPPYDYRTKCIDDHEQRLRHLEANNKEQAKLFVMSEKLEGQIQALDDKNAVRFAAIEKWMDAQIAIAAVQLATKKEQIVEKRDWKSDVFGIAALIISVSLLILNLLK
jgi:hypothetical protein